MWAEVVDRGFSEFCFFQIDLETEVGSRGGKQREKQRAESEVVGR